MWHERQHDFDMITAINSRIGIRWKIAVGILSILILSPGRPREAHEMRKRLGRGISKRRLCGGDVART